MILRQDRWRCWKACESFNAEVQHSLKLPIPQAPTRCVAATGSGRRWTCRFHLQRCNGLSALALQAEHLLEAAGENPQTAREAVSAAAWFNFGIVLFDSLIDRGGEGARAVTR